MPDTYTPGNVYDLYRVQVNCVATTSIAISAGGGAASTSLTLASAPGAALQPGMLFLTTGGTAEATLQQVTSVSGTTVTFTPAYVNGGHTGITFGYPLQGTSFSDDFKQNAVNALTPSANTRVLPYSTQQTTDSWVMQHKQKLQQT